MPDNQAYADQLLQLAPPGKAFPRDRSSELGALALAFGDEFGRLDQRGQDLIVESDPRTTDELLADWEAFCGLPDPAIPAPVTTADRQLAICNKLLTRGDQRPAAFEAIAVRFGYTATFTYHYPPFAAGIAYGGMPVLIADTVYWWIMNVTVPIGTPTPVLALEHYVRLAAPLHTVPTFTYIFA